MKVSYPKIFWTPCVVHTLNLALKNICVAKNTEKNKVIHEECSWITCIADNASFICVFIINHSMRLAMFNEFCPLKLLQVADTRFASVIVMLKMLKLIKRSLQVRGGARIFCLGGPNFVTNILVSSQDKPSHSDINAHTQI